MDSRMNTISVMDGSRQGVSVEILITYLTIIVEVVSGIIGRIGRVLNIQSKPLVIISAIVTFFAFTLGAFTLGCISGVVFFLALRPYVN